MKNLYHKSKNKDKGKVCPSPSSSLANNHPSSTTTTNKDEALSMLNLLPSAILALVSILSLEDCEVLAYLITKSMKSSNPSNPSSSKCKNKIISTNNNNNTHKPLFDCDCFDCYTSYWFRWDSSPNRELIHQVIEAFEEYLTKGELNNSNNGGGGGRGKKKDKMGRRGIDNNKQDDKLKNKWKTPVEVPMEVPVEKKTIDISSHMGSGVVGVELDSAEILEDHYEECDHVG